MTDIMDAVQEKLARDFRAVLVDVEDLLRLTAGQAGGQIDELRERLQQKLQRARAELQGLEDRAARRVHEAIGGADRYAHAHPWGTAGVAAAAGLLVGLIVRRR